MKPVEFLGSSRIDLASFPEIARRLAGFQLQRLQQGEEPRDFKPLVIVGPGVQELRVWAEAGTFRVIYLARFEEAIYILHAFEKKTQRTRDADIDLARRRYRELLRARVKP